MVRARHSQMIFNAMRKRALGGDSPPPPPVSLSASVSGNPTSGTVPFTVTFVGTAAGGPDPTNPNSYAFNWVFGDGGIASGANTNHTFTVSGNFTTTLTVTSGNQTATATVSISATASQTRNAYLWPFASDSAVNTPIGSAASFVDHPVVRSVGCGFNGPGP